MLKSRSLFVLVLLAGACDGDSPGSAASAPAAAPRRAEPRSAASPVASISPGWARSQVAGDSEPEVTPEPSFDPVSVLDDEERRLLAADDATLTREDRVARAEAQKKLVMADPEHPLGPVIAKLERNVASGEYAAMAEEMWSGRAAFPEHGEDPRSQL